jgi:hypothetical protein
MRQDFFKLVGQLRLKHQFAIIHRPQELQSGRVQELAIQGDGLFPMSIDRITNNGMPSEGQVDPDLVGAPGLWPAFHQSCLSILFQRPDDGLSYP